MQHRIRVHKQSLFQTKGVMKHCQEALSRGDHLSVTQNADFTFFTQKENKEYIQCSQGVCVCVCLCVCVFGGGGSDNHGPFDLTNVFEASAFSKRGGELALEQKEEWQLTLDSGTNPTRAGLLLRPTTSYQKQVALLPGHKSSV